MADIDDGSYCPYFHRTVELIGRRWTGAVLLAMSAGRSSFGDIRDAIPGISERLLTERLKELEGEGVVVRTVHGRSSTYEMTAKGCGLSPILDAIGAYAAHWGPEAPGCSGLAEPTASNEARVVK